MATKVCAIERTHAGQASFCSVFGWMGSVNEAMTWPDRAMAQQHLAQMVLPPGVIRVIEIDKPEEQKALPEVRADYDPFGYGV